MSNLWTVEYVLLSFIGSTIRPPLYRFSLSPAYREGKWTWMNKARTRIETDEWGKRTPDQICIITYHWIAININMELVVKGNTEKLHQDELYMANRLHVFPVIAKTPLRGGFMHMRDQLFNSDFWWKISASVVYRLNIHYTKIVRFGCLVLRSRPLWIFIYKTETRILSLSEGEKSGAGSNQFSYNRLNIHYVLYNIGNTKRNHGRQFDIDDSKHWQWEKVINKISATTFFGQV